MPSKSRILVVEDNDMLRALLSENLAECGYDVSQARDGQEALQMIANCQPDILLTDLIMPRQEGLAVITEVRKRFPAVRIIAMSGGGRNKSADFLQMASKLGADSVLEKPIEIEALESAIRSLAS